MGAGGGEIPAAGRGYDGVVLRGSGGVVCAGVTEVCARVCRRYVRGCAGGVWRGSGGGDLARVWWIWSRVGVRELFCAGAAGLVCGGAG